MLDDLLEIEYENCNEFIIKFFNWLVICSMIALILNYLEVFKLDKVMMTKIVCICIILLMVPVIYYLLVEQSNSLRFAYITATVLVITIVISYTFFSFHVSLIYLLPATVFSLYGKRRLLYYVIIITIAGMIISHLLSMKLSIVPEDPYRSYYACIVYSLLPKLIIYQSYVSVFLFETKHNQQLIRKLFKYSNKLHSTQEELIISFAQMCESKSEYTGKHVKRVSRYANTIAKKLGMSVYECECLSIASMMHDVGKLNIPSEILEKNGKLTMEEFEIIKKHTQIGHELIKGSPGDIMQIASEITLNHHERWDGNGYNGLKGEEIHIYSRIMAIVDVFDALVSKRSYKEAWSVEKAYEEIVSQSGIMFDPKIVTIFKKSYYEFIEILDSMGD
ncbi:MAG: HD-GYP domain-containing protein [Lachnospiraceae bacterium]